MIEDLPRMVTLVTERSTFALSDNGMLAWLDGAPKRNLVWVDRQGITTPLGTEQEAFPSALRLSPDGKRVVFTSDNDLYVIDIERGTRMRLTVAGTLNIEPI